MHMKSIIKKWYYSVVNFILFWRKPVTVNSRQPNPVPDYIYEGSDDGLFESADGSTLNRTPKQIQANINFLAQQIDLRTSIAASGSSPASVGIGGCILVGFTSGTVVLLSTNADAGELIKVYVPSVTSISVRLDTDAGTIIDTITGTGEHVYRYNGSTFIRVPNGTDTRKLYDSIHGKCTLSVEDGASAADAYVLNIASGEVPPQSLFNGLTTRFFVVSGHENTGPSAVNAYGLGAKTLVDSNGNALGGGEVVGLVEIMFDLANDRWLLYTLNTGSVADYTPHVNHFFKESASNNYIDIDQETVEDQYNTFGPTGSGADHILSDMDGIPTNAKFLYVTIQCSVNTAVTSDLITMLIETRRMDDTANKLLHYSTGLGRCGGITNNGIIPLDDNNMFKLQWSSSGTISSSTTRMWVTGFGR